jgi:two-component sensor histidine kinase
MIGQTVRRLIPEERQNEEDTILARVAAGSTHDFENYETVRLHKSGRLLDVGVTISPIRDEAGRVIGASKIARDISRRKQAEKRIQLLLHEVNHRTKNIISVVQAVAQRTAASSPDDFVQRFSERLNALASSQDVLIMNQGQGVEISALVLSQLAHFKGLVGTRIELGGPPLNLSAVAAQTIGMALHELATNAAKYGALSNSTGQFEISWRLEGGGRFTLSWTERGGPPVSAPTRYGFGSTLIKSVPKTDLDADVALDYAPTGVAWRLECDAAAVLSAGGQPSDDSEPK